MRQLRVYEKLADNRGLILSGEDGNDDGDDVVPVIAVADALLSGGIAEEEGEWLSSSSSVRGRILAELSLLNVSSSLPSTRLKVD